jgi:hypothetical protein
MNPDPQTTECILERDPTGRLRIKQAPEIFLCNRGAIEGIVTRHNQQIDLLEEAERKNTETTHALQQALTRQGAAEALAESRKRIIDELKAKYRDHHDEAERLTNENRRLLRALQQIANQDYRGNRSHEQNIAINALKP